MDFHIGTALAALHDVGNEADDLHFYGGQYGIITRKPSPGWQFTLLDATFEGQSHAAIKEHEAGLTLIRASNQQDADGNLDRSGLCGGAMGKGLTLRGYQWPSR